MEPFSLINVSYNDVRKNIKFPKEITPLLSEFIGFHMGDGHYNLHKNNSYYFFYGADPKTEREYYDNYIKLMFHHLFNINIIPRDFKTVYGFYIYSKGLFYFLNKVLKIPKGKKNNLEVPDYIVNNSTEIKCSFLRGLFDTDGSFNPRRNGKYIYPRISIATINKKLMYQSMNILTSLNVKSSIYNYKNIDKRTKKEHSRWVLTINGFKEVNKWLKLIGTSSPKHRARIKDFFNSNPFK